LGLIWGFIRVDVGSHVEKKAYEGRFPQLENSLSDDVTEKLEDVGPEVWTS